ncbi:MAG: hypothetical protein H6Q73_2562 [Firmicutes bacterium]|nr:hypothetical protein [Bacillota bacterium]
MNKLQIFKNAEFGEIRIVEVESNPYAVGSDVAKSLEYSIPHKAVRDHCRGVLTWNVPHPQSPEKEQEVLVIPEGDIYRLIVKAADQSRNPVIKEKAERFERWIFDEVLPSIRKYDMYATEELLNDPDLAIKAFTALKEERARRIKAESTNAILMHVNKTYTATEIAKELGFKSATSLNNDLANRKIQFKQNETWVLYSKYADKGYVEIKQDVLDNGRVIYHRRWTQIGREFLVKMYQRKAS